MKIIVSHDVDYIAVWEHKDLSIPKAIFRMIVESVFENTIGWREIIHRTKEFWINKWHNIPDLLSYEVEEKIPSTYFFGVKKGLGLCYNNDLAKKWIKFVQKKNFKVGLHGINHCDLDKMREEKILFEKISGIETSKTGIRIHYLRRNPNTLQYLSRLGYLFDSSTMELRDPYKIGSMWEFPISIMDTYIFNDGKFWQVRKFKEAKKETIKVLNKALKKKLKFFTILFHDNRFSDSYKDAKEWFIWLIDFLKSRDFEFVNFIQAIKELELEES